jgi:hypothetical protein
VVGAACNFLQISFADISKDQGNLSEAEKVAMLKDVSQKILEFQHHDFYRVANQDT